VDLFDQPVDRGRGVELLLKQACDVRFRDVTTDQNGVRAHRGAASPAPRAPVLLALDRAARADRHRAFAGAANQQAREEIFPVFAATLSETGRIVVASPDPRGPRLHVLPEAFLGDAEVGPTFPYPCGFWAASSPSATGPPRAHR